MMLLFSYLPSLPSFADTAPDAIVLRGTLHLLLSNGIPGSWNSSESGHPEWFQYRLQA
jgi:hypothetical protein